MKEIQKIRDKYQDPVFRMALYHMIQTGMKHFDEENVAAGKASVLENEAIIEKEGCVSVFPASLQNQVIDCAAALAKFETKDILRFVKHYVNFEGNEKIDIRCKNCNKVISDDEGTLINDGYEDAFYECDRCHESSLEYESVILCESCGAYYTPNHANDNDEKPCPYCSD